MPFTFVKDAIEAVAIYLSNKLTFLGGGVGALFGFLHQNLVAICGIALGLVGYFTNLYFQKRKDAREERLAQRQLEKWRTAPAPLEGDQP